MSQFMEVIEWVDQTGSEIVHRYPEKGSAEIKFGAQLVVRENQAAIFFRDGKTKTTSQLLYLSETRCSSGGRQGAGGAKGRGGRMPRDRAAS